MRRSGRAAFWYLRRRPRAMAADLEEEFQFHLNMRVRDLLAEGESPERARERAAAEFGDIVEARRYCLRQDRASETRVMWTIAVDEIVQDIRIAFRGLVRSALVTAAIVATVGLGIGATAAIVATVNATLLRPLPYKNPQELVRIYTDSPPNRFPLSVADYIALTGQQTRYAALAGYTGRSLAFTDGSVAERLHAQSVTWTYFNVLGVAIAHGRDFHESDSMPGSPSAVIVSDAFWRRRLHGTIDRIGQSIRLDGAASTVVGVLPPSAGPLEEHTDVFVAAQWAPPTRKGPFFIGVVARLRSDADRQAAADELHAINRRMFPIWRSSYQDERATWGQMDLKTWIVGDVRQVAVLGLVSVGLLWVIACVNAASLLVARLASRRHELAVRAALGASRSRLVRYLLAESALLAVGAAFVGLLIASLGIDLLRTVAWTYIPRAGELTFDGTVIATIAVTTIVSIALFGLIPSLHGATGSAAIALRESNRSTAGSAVSRTLRHLLIGSQFAITTPLLIAAGLLILTLARLGQVDVGFDTHRLITASVSLPHVAYADPGSIRAFWDTLGPRLSAVPGVAGVAFADGRPPRDVSDLNNFQLEDAPTETQQPVTPWLAVTPDYFDVVGLKLIEGRLLDEHDAQAQDILAVVVDRAWAQRFFPNRSAVGRRLKQGGCTTCPWTTVVGVVSNVKYTGLDKPDTGTVYWGMSSQESSRFLVVRGHANVAVLGAAIRRTVASVDTDVPVSDIATVDELISDALVRPKSLSVLVLSIAIAALLLSLIGIYGTMAYYVQQHEKAIGIRLALGGTPSNVLFAVARHGLTVVAAGMAVGLVIAMATGALVSDLLFEVTPHDPMTFIVVTSVMFGVATIACVIPARKAALVAPSILLRE